MNSIHAKRVVAVQEGRCDLHALRLDAHAAIDLTFDEIEGRLARYEGQMRTAPDAGTSRAA